MGLAGSFVSNPVFFLCPIQLVSKTDKSMEYHNVDRCDLNHPYEWRRSVFSRIETRMTSLKPELSEIAGLYRFVRYYPKVNKALLRITSFIGLLFGLLNMVTWFALNTKFWWMGLVHLPLLLISAVSLILSKRVDGCLTR